MNYFIATYGCQMNKADSERIASLLETKGYKSAGTMDQADLVVVNMCSVRQSAVDRIYGLNHRIQKLRDKRPNVRFVLTGCIVRKDKLALKEVFDDIWDNDYINAIPAHRNNSTALIPISNGCNNYCSYCVVPFTRGKLSCRDHKEIIKEAKESIKNGFKELWLLGQNVNDYQSPADPSINFAKLLKMVSELPGDFKIRFTSPDPRNFTDELIDVMAESEKVAKFINLPVQSGDNQILEKMNRHYTAKDYLNLVKKIRRAMPDINLTTDVIVGFPGETEDQFNSTVRLFKEAKFNLAYINKYSPRVGTAAATMENDVPLDEKKRREKILAEIIKNG